MEEPKRKKIKGGRPEKQVKRQQIVCVRFTKTERFIVTQKAEKAKLTLSNYIRESAIHASVTAKLSREDRHFFRQFTGLANNINQMAKLAHQEGLLSALFRFENELEEIDKALKKFKK